MGIDVLCIHPTRNPATFAHVSIPTSLRASFSIDSPRPEMFVSSQIAGISFKHPNCRTTFEPFLLKFTLVVCLNLGAQHKAAQIKRWILNHFKADPNACVLPGTLTADIHLADGFSDDFSDDGCTVASLSVMMHRLLGCLLMHRRCSTNVGVR